MGLFDKLKKKTETSENQLFVFDKAEECYVATINSIKFECDDLEEISEEYIQELADAYQTKVETIAKHIMDDIKDFYEDITVEELVDGECK